MNNTFSVPDYRSAKVLSNIVSVLFGLLLLLNIVYIIGGFGLLIYPDSVIRTDDGESMQIFMILIGLLSIFEILTRIVTIVVFLIWEHRAFSNLSPLKAHGLEFSPGWAVGWWFIPFANLIKPFQVMKELWRESDPDIDEEPGFTLPASGGSSVLGFWWALWIIGSISGRIVDKVTPDNGNSSQIFALMLIISAMIFAIAAGLIIWIVRDITKRQELRSERVGMRIHAQPPPPPTFHDTLPSGFQ